MGTKLAEIRTRLSEIDDEMDRIVRTAETHKRSLSTGENAKVELLLDERKPLALLADVENEALVQREARTASTPPGVMAAITSPGRTETRGGVYTPNGQYGYFKDKMSASQGDSEARERLDRHGKEYQSFTAANAHEYRAISATDGAGGEFVPPLWLIDDYIAALRPARATADALTNVPLPAGTDTIMVPKVATGATTAIQATQNTAISSTDITTNSVTGSVFTIAGGQTYSNQLFEQSPLAGTIDKMILQDLLADYAQRLGALVINGTGTGQPFGLLNVSGITAITYTDATPAFMGAGKLYAKIASAVAAVQTARYQSPTGIIMHPRRWNWLASVVDSAGRAVLLPSENGPMNASAIDSNGNAQGIVGRMLGLPVIADPNVPINTGSGTNQDPVIVAKLDDSWLYEGEIRTEVFPQTYANTLSMFARVYNYVGLVHRLPQSIAVINGTGLVTPTF